MDRLVTVGAYGRLVETGRPDRAEAHVKLWNGSVAGVAQFTDLLMCEHMPIWAAVGRVARRAAFGA